MRSIAVAVVAVLTWAAAAHAEDLPRERRFLTVQHVKGPGELAAAPTVSRTIFMNRCTSGCRLSPRSSTDWCGRAWLSEERTSLIAGR